MGSTCQCGPSVSTSGGGATRPRCRVVTPRIRTPRRSAGGWRRPIRRSSGGRPRGGGGSTGATETAAAPDHQPRRGYAREGQPARIDVPDPHIRMNLIATISNEGSVHFMTYKQTMTAALFITFLERLLGETTRKIFLIVDWLKAHEAKKVEAWAADHQERIEIFFLPRYAPERNPDEYLNNDIKGGINATGLPDNKEELRSRMLGFMSKLVHLPQHVRNYFQHPCVQYAAGV